MELHTTTLREQIPSLRAGQRVLLSGTVYTARDAAHKRLMALLNAGENLPFDLSEAVIFYSGSTPAPPGLAIGACGPTTSSRMDPFAPRLYEAGVCATIGKGERSAAVTDAICKTGGIYFCALGGAGALAAQHVTACDVIAFPELGCEAVKRLTFHEFPLIVDIDCYGYSIFQQVKE